MKRLILQQTPTWFFLATVLGSVAIGSSQQAPIMAGPPVAAAPPAVQLTDAQMQTQLAPIALYPDALLAQILPASTYPLQIVLAQRWLQANPNPTQAMIDAQNFEPSIKALVHYPKVLAMLNNQLEWTQSLGVAFLNQQADVMTAIQELRRQARTAGALQSTPQQQVVTDDNDTIEIVPANPDVIYVPEYDGLSVYAGGALSFGVGYPEGLWLDNNFDWHHHWLAAGIGWHHGWDNPVRDPRTEGEPITRPWGRNAAQPMPVRSAAVYDNIKRGVGPGYEAPKAREPAPGAFNGYQNHVAVQRQVERAQQSRPAPAAPVRSEPVRSEPVRSEPVRSAPVRSEPVRSAPVRSAPAQVFHAEGSGRSVSAQSARGNASRSAGGGGGGGRKR